VAKVQSANPHVFCYNSSKVFNVLNLFCNLFNVKMGDSREKSVIVIVDNDIGDDLDLIQKKLLAKSESVKNCTQVSDIVFKKQSKIREGVWVVMSKESPVKSGSIIQCSFKSKKLLAFTSEKKGSTNKLKLFNQC
jgi:hypothetical protein